MVLNLQANNQMQPNVSAVTNERVLFKWFLYLALFANVEISFLLL